MPQFQGSLGPLQELTRNPNPEAVPQEKTGLISNRRASDGDAIDRAHSVGMRNGLIGGCLLWALLLWGLAWLAS